MELTDQETSSDAQVRAAARRTRWGLIFALWSLPALVSASQAYVRERGATSWLRTLAFQLPSWWIWALLTPLVLRLAERHPIGRTGWVGPVALHLGAGSIVVLVYIVVQAPFALLREDRDVTLGSWTSAVGGGLLFQYLSHLLIYFGILGIGHAVLYRRQSEEREAHAHRLEHELQSTRLAALRARLKPHFLFNTLHTVGGLVRADRREEAIETLTGLSGLLRFTLEAFEEPDVPLHWEMEALERYVAIQEVRFEDRLSVSRTVDPAAAETRVPALILQPLVENALQHAISPGTERLHVTIDVRAESGRLVMTVEDDGIGVAPDFDAARHGGLGLRLTADRLAALYPGAHDFTIVRRSEGGTRVLISIPASSTAP